METWTHRDKRIALQNRIVIVFSVKKRYCIMKNNSQQSLQQQQFWG